MNCSCHGEPCYWQKDSRSSRGGQWECRVRRRAHNAARYTDPERRERINQKKRDRYDSDFVYRIGSNLKKDATARRRRMNRRKEALDGSLSQ